jgi:hypothetical protein
MLKIEQNKVCWYGTVLAVRQNITESEILSSYENNGNKSLSYLHCKSTKVKALQLFNALRTNITEDKIISKSVFFF